MGGEGMSAELDFEKVFADFPRVLFPYDKTLPVRGWLVQGPTQQVVFWHSKAAYESEEHRHPYAEWGIVITGWCDIITPQGRRRYQAGEVFHLQPDVPHASVTSDDYRSMDVFFSPSHLRAEPGEGT
jgi:quercetin dioxygenase-like cupin family protein